LDGLIHITSKGCADGISRLYMLSIGKGRAESHNGLP
jgi:hypothetical protein